VQHHPHSGSVGEVATEAASAPGAANGMAGLTPGHGKNEWGFYGEEETKLSLQSSTYFSVKWLSVAGQKQ